MELTIREKGDLVQIDVTGGITQKQLNPSEDKLVKLVGPDVYSRKVLINLQGNDFIDSSGISWLLVCHKRCIENNGRLVLHSVPQLVDNVLKVLRMDTVFDLAENEADALRKIEEANS